MELSFIEFDGFDWDQGNILKCQKHGVSLGEIEDLFLQEVLIALDKRHSRKEERSIAIGTSKRNKLAFVSFTFRKKKDRTLIRPISARYMHEKERKVYEGIKKKLES